MKEKLTIITVTYNCERTLQRTIDSVFNQDFNEYEYLIIDGGSTDNTISIIEDNIKKFEGRLRYISESDNGLYDAMNKGIKLAKGKYIGIINGDDYYNENIFENVIKLFELDDTDIIYSDLLFVNSGYIDYKKPLVGNHNNLKHRMSVNHPTCFVKKSVYDKYGDFNIEYKIAADYEIMVRFYMMGCKFIKYPEVLAIMETGGLSSNNSKSISEKYKIHNNYFGTRHAMKCMIKNILIFYFRKSRDKYGGKK